MITRMSPQHFNEVSAFRAVANAGSFRGAALDLGLSPSTLSHAVKALEKRLGVRLFHRTTRSVALTEAGERLLGELSPILTALDSTMARASFAAEVPRGTVRLAAPALALHTLVMPHIGALARDFPHVVLDIRTVEKPVDLVAEGFDLAIQLGGDVGQDIIVIALTDPFETAVVGSPSYFARHAPPLHPRDLADHLCIGCRSGPGQSLYRWRFARDGEQVTMDVAGPLITDDAEVMLRGALDGVGLWHGLEHLTRDHIAAGRLQRVLADWSPSNPGYSLCYTQGAPLPPAARAVVDRLKQANRSDVPGRTAEVT